MIGNSKLGGLERRYSKAFAKLQEKNHNSFLVVNQDLYNGLLQHSIISSSTPNIFIVKQKTSFKSFKTPLKFQLFAAFEILKIVLKHRINNLHLVQTQILISSILTLFPVKNKIITFAHTDFDPGYERGLKRLLLKFVLARVNRIDFLSNDIKNKYLKKYPLLSDQTENLVTPCSYIDYEKFIPGEKHKTIISLSRLDPIKNTKLLVEAIHIIINERKLSLDGYKCLILGDGPCKEELEELIKRYSIGKYVELGYAFNPVDYLKHSTIFVSIQQTNNYPSQSLIEAMACENAVIASDVGETRLLVDEQNGVLVELNSEIIADAILSLIQNPVLLDLLRLNSRSKVLCTHTIENFLGYLVNSLYR
ncbi:Glycosyltransferase involved in cell wall bisynthesis [Pontibacter akesuensis]|uniref:Glycosyltransferase involved in cell wall bisynthesis n=2 Tax=Pontibacter akesuensis TaxID=388950 RepID=A0A1I7GBR0_9BACT|nr:hypothetical protein GCM10007389_06710 [Pontibacter akesuensis]SFU45899.1 Glycosyltransferase involved in cell wall bisynthesis [Pontibacter akesuensis]